MTRRDNTRSDAIAQAIVALTAAAKQTRTIGRGTWNEHQEAADFAELAAIDEGRAWRDGPRC